MKKSETFNFGPWTVTSVKGTILKADTSERFVSYISKYFFKNIISYLQYMNDV